MHHRTSNLNGKVALVTGGTSGIGRAAALRLASRGASVCVSSRREAAVEKTVAELRTASPGVKATGLPCDVAREEDVNALAEHTVRELGGLDILVHSAGILRLPGSSLQIMPLIDTAEIHAVLDTNIKGTFYANRAAARVMTGQKSGVIVNVASILGKIARPFTSVYCASKFGVVGMTEAFAEEMRSYNVKVFAVLPDAVKTPFWEKDGPASAKDFALEPDRVAAFIEHLVCLPEGVTIANTVIAPFRGTTESTETVRPGEPT